MKKSRLKRLLAALLGRGSEKNNGDVWHKCPFCKHSKSKLSINIISEKWHCWHCNAKGRKLFMLLRKIKASAKQVEELNDIMGEAVKTVSKKREEYVSLPLDFIPLLNGTTSSPHYKNAIHYLKSRGLSKLDILRHNIGYAESGEYSGMIIIPSYDSDGVVNYFVSRAYYETNFKHKNPNVSKDVIGFDLIINWNKPINIVEGAFDAIATGENSIPLFGKILPDSLRKKIIQKKVKRVNLILDNDAIKAAIKHSEYFMGNGIDVHLIDLPGKDPSDLGTDVVNSLIELSQKLTFGKIMEYKINATC
tara:strand:- start:211 stop:1128 length:918 start_codon:yes stop_codon:yes gene_type:complete